MQEPPPMPTAPVEAAVEAPVEASAAEPIHTGDPDEHVAVEATTQ